MRCHSSGVVSVFYYFRHSPFVPALAGRVGVRPCAVEPVGGARLPPGVIRSTVRDHLMSSSGSPRRCGPDRPRPETLQDDVPNERSQFPRATSEFLLGVHEVHGRAAPRRRRRSWFLSTRFLSEPRPTVHEVLGFPRRPWIRRTGQRADFVTPTRGVRESFRVNAEDQHQHIVG